MTSKDYRMVAEIIRHTDLPESYSDSYEDAERVRVKIAEALATRFKQENHRFKETKFLEACNVAV